MIHFISGLPRSGSTLLASILRQNPKHTASIMTPLGRIVTETLTSMGPNNEAEGFMSDAQRADVLLGLIDGFYANRRTEVVFDNNRRWCANAALLNELYPQGKIICCLRSPANIVDSFERLFRAHPLSLSVIYGGHANLTVYERAVELMKPTGVLGYALNAFRDAFFGPHRDKLLCVNYDDLCRFPERTLSAIHVALGLEPFTYDFDKIEPIPGAADFDRRVNTPGLHDLKPKVTYEMRTTVLPPDIYASLPQPFWKMPVQKEVT